MEERSAFELLTEELQILEMPLVSPLILLWFLLCICVDLGVLTFGLSSGNIQP
jgi:hypothetical protein